MDRPPDQDVWFADPEFAEANKAAFNEVLNDRWAQIVEAVVDLAAAVDARVGAGAVEAVEATATGVAAELRELGLTVPGVLHERRSRAAHGRDRPAGD